MRYGLRCGLMVLWMLFLSVTSAIAQVSIGIGLPGVSIGINFPLYPDLVQVPGYPVYYAPRLDSNFFFYDGMYWVYQRDNWYASSWYNGPWGLVGPEVVPLFVLRIPVSYYRNPPPYFRGWRADGPPRWGEHWGNNWAQQRRGWDNWNRSSAPAPAPLPVYQRQYSGDRYPRVEQQQAFHSQNYRYQPHDPVVRQHYQEQAVQRAPAPAQREQQGVREDRSPGRQDTQRAGPTERSSPTAPLQQGGSGAARAQPQQSPPQSPPQSRSPSPQQSQPQSQQRGGDDVQRSAPNQAPAQQRGPAVQDQRQQPQQGAVQREQQTPRSSQENNPPGKGASQESRPRQGQGQGQERDREKGEERGQERNK